MSVICAEVARKGGELDFESLHCILWHFLTVSGLCSSIVHFGPTPIYVTGSLLSLVS